VKIIVGLGNPGRQYAATRHNVGWMVVDRLADRAGWGSGRERDASRVVWGRYRDLDVVLVKPLTFMNESGLAVRKVLAREHAPLDELLVVCDDFALPFGRLRLRAAGSAGGHNGLRSIIGELGGQGFARLRVGIGEPDRSAIDHVLSRFETPEQGELPAVLDAAADAAEAWARDGAARAASAWNAWRLTEPAVDGVAPLPPPPPDVGADGIRRSSTGWRRVLRPDDEDPPRERRA
jgi:peptidyl-tRNA hydrolase, PTH1 family